MPFCPFRSVHSIAATLAAVFSLVTARSGQCQIPGSELDNGSRARAQYLEAVFTDVKVIMDDWREALLKGDLKRLKQMVTEDGLYSPVEGWYVQGRDAVLDSLTSRATRLKGYHATLLDFTASGGLAYYLGRVGYQLDNPNASRQVTGTFVMVLYQSGRRWKVRSYVERSGSD